MTPTPPVGAFSDPHGGSSLHSGQAFEKKRTTVWRWFMSAVEKDTDTAIERTRKNVIFPLTVIIIINQFGFALVRAYEGKWFWFILNTIRAMIGVVVASYSVATKSIPLLLLEVALLSGGFLMAIVGDFFGFGREDMWSLVVLLMDGLLLTNCRPMAAYIACTMATIYVMIKTVEEGVGLGLYESVPSSWVGDIHPRPTEDLNWTITVMFIRCLVLLLDFTMTRKFAFGMRDEQEKSAASVVLAEQIASALARFDLDTASRLVGSNQDELSVAFRTLLGNLKLYKPYLPEALFSTLRSDYSPMPPRLNPPCSNGGPCTIVFTDIQASTDIWEGYPTFMREAMHDHNTVMRQAIHESDGYEVKTIGDAFMVAFDTAKDAMMFSLTAQVRLYENTWPEGLLEYPLCTAMDCWNGLRVRIGIHTGVPKFEMNPVTRRADYLGPVVNKAARVENASVGGAIAITDSVLSSLTPTDLIDLENPFIVGIGTWDLKGLGDTVLHLVLPRKLEGRQPEMLLLFENRRQQLHTLLPVEQSVSSIPSLRYLVGPVNDNKLAHAVCSIAVLKIDFGVMQRCEEASPTANKLLSIITECVDRSEGLVGSLLSGWISVSWNASKPCAMHVSQSMNFASALFKSLGATVWRGHNWCGIATGSAVHGALGSKRQKLFTVISDVVELAVGLSESAKILLTPCLVAGNQCAAFDPSLSQHTRPIDDWDGVSVYEVNMSTFSSSHGVWDLFDGPIPVEWSDYYKDVFFSGDLHLLHSMSATDPMLPKVIKIMEKRLVLPVPSYCGLRITPEDPPPEWYQLQNPLRM